MQKDKVIAENVQEVKKVDTGKYDIVYKDGSTETRLMDRGEHFGLITKMRHIREKKEKLSLASVPAEPKIGSEAAELPTSSENSSKFEEDVYPDLDYDDHFDGQRIMAHSYSVLDVELADPENFIPAWPTDADMHRFRSLGIPGCGRHLSKRSLSRLVNYGNPGESVKLDEIIRVNEHTLYIIPKKNWERYQAAMKAQSIKITDESLPDYMRRGGMEVNHPAAGIKVNRSISRT